MAAGSGAQAAHRQVDHEELVVLLRRDGVPAVATEVRNAGLQIGLMEGQDLTRWSAHGVGGAVCFIRSSPAPDGSGYVIDRAPRVLCVRAAPSEAAEWRIESGIDAEDVLVLFDSTGRVTAVA